MATNTNNDNDMTTVTTTNNNTNNPAGRSYASSFFSFFSMLFFHLLRILGTSESRFLYAFKESARRMSAREIFDRSEHVSGLLSCAEEMGASGECMDQGVCHHFAQEHRDYDGNMLLRAAEVLVVALKTGCSPAYVGLLWELGVKRECQAEFTCQDMKAASCFGADHSAEDENEGQAIDALAYIDLH